MKFSIITLILCISQALTLKAQLAYTANGKVNAYQGPFSFGVNGGYFGPAWLGDKQGSITLGPAGAGGTGIRYTLPHHFLETWGYNINLQVYEQNKKLGALDNLVFLEGPSPASVDMTRYCKETESKIFKDIYLPVWDSNFGTPVNENNPYALYVYKTVTLYKNYVKFWEIWNEPDFTPSSHAWESGSQPLSWYNQNPGACDLPNLLAPVQAYVRLLRISYEVIKFVDPGAYITTGGIGYDSFLDAVLRNTDNPDNGAVTAAYPNKGGAYFDVLSYHHYPQYSVSGKRHSDAAAESIAAHLNEFKSVLYKYGYDGIKMPRKEFIISEINISRKSFEGYIGGTEVQKNFILKAPVVMQANQIRQMYLFGISDSKLESEATNSYELMGLYESLSEVKPSEEKLTVGGIAFKTASLMLYGAAYDPERTLALKLPPSVGGGAFKKDNGYTYVLWAKTTVDNQERAAANYTFPSLLDLGLLVLTKWDESVRPAAEIISSTNISLTVTPVFLSEPKLAGALSSIASDPTTIVCFPNPYQEQTQITINLTNKGPVEVSIFNLQGMLVKKIFNSTSAGAGAFTLMLQDIDLPAGTYVLKLTCSQSVYTTKLVRLP